MDFDFTDDQERCATRCANGLTRATTSNAARGITQAGGFSREAYGELADLGLPGLYIPEADGGLGMGPVEGMVVMEELGRGIVLEPFAQTLIAGWRALLAMRPMPSRRTGCPKSPRAKAWWCWPTRNAPPATTSKNVKQKRLSAPGWMVADSYQKHSAGRRPGRCLHRSRDGRRPDGAVSGGTLGGRRRHARLRHAGRRARRRSHAGRCARRAGHPGRLDRAGARHGHRHRRHLRRSRRRDGQDAGRHGRVHEHAQAVRRGHQQLSGAAPPHRRHEDAAGTGPLDELLRLAQAQCAGRQNAAARWRGPSTSWACRCALSASRRCSCTAASA